MITVRDGQGMTKLRTTLDIKVSELNSKCYLIEYRGEHAQCYLSAKDDKFLIKVKLPRKSNLEEMERIIEAINESNTYVSLEDLEYSISNYILQYDVFKAKIGYGKERDIPTYKKLGSVFLAGLTLGALVSFFVCSIR